MYVRADYERGEHEKGDLWDGLTKDQVVHKVRDVVFGVTRAPEGYMLSTIEIGLDVTEEAAL